MTLTFNEPVSPLVIRLLAPDGGSIPPRAVVAENNTITVGVARKPAARHARAELARDLGRRASGRRRADVRGRRTERTTGGGSGGSCRSWRAPGIVDGQGRALCRALRRRRRCILLRLDRRPGFAAAVAAVAPCPHQCRAGSGPGLGRPAGHRCARSCAIRLDAEGELANRPRDLLWADRDRRRQRAVCRILRLRGGVLAQRPGFGARRPPRRGACTFAQRPRQHGAAAVAQPSGAAPARPLRGVLDRGAVAARIGLARCRRARLVVGGRRARALLPYDRAGGRAAGAERAMARVRATRPCRRAVDDGLRPGARMQACCRRRPGRACRRQPLPAGAEVRT